MIKFFRQIRQQLVSQNKFSKYMLYAIGEIVLVVIGILIALQLNNYNEQGKNRIIEKEYLVKLRDEFELNKKIILRDISFHETQLESSSLLLSLMTSDTIVSDLNRLHLATMHTGYAWHGAYRDDVWSELINTGNQRLISNDSIRFEITRFLSNADRVIENETEWEDYNLKYREISGNVLPPNLRIQVALATGFDDIDGTVNYNLLSLEEIRENLKKVNGLNSVLTDIIIVRRVGLILLKKNLTLIKDLIFSLNQEIENFRS